MLKAIIHRRPHLSLMLIFGLGTSLTSVTLIVPFYTTFPTGAMVEGLVGLVMETNSYSKVGFGSMWVFILLSIATIVLATRLEIKRRGRLKMRSRVGTYVALLFLFNPLTFYLYWWLKLDFRDDGQLFFAVVETSVYAGIFFVIPGITLEIVREYALKLSPLPIAEEEGKLSEEPCLNDYEVSRLLKMYVGLSKGELEKIFTEDGWTEEAKTAARQVLDQRSISPPTV